MEMTAGKIHTAEVASEVCNETFEIQDYLPKNFTDLYKHNVIITFDSQDFFKYGQIERIYQKLRVDEEIERAIIVGVPYPSVEWRNHYFSPNGEHHENMVTFVGRELLKWIDSNFNTLNMANSRVLMGESLAGTLAFSVALQYQTTFQNAWAFSQVVDAASIGRLTWQAN